MNLIIKSNLTNGRIKCYHCEDFFGPSWESDVEYSYAMALDWPTESIHCSSYFIRFDYCPIMNYFRSIVYSSSQLVRKVRSVSCFLWHLGRI
jgi:hypothetical protein